MDNFPNFIISLIDSTKKKDAIKNSTFYENYKYLLGFCLPQGKETNKNTFLSKNNSKKYYHCTDKDYAFLISKILEIFQDMEGAKVTAIELNRYNNRKEFPWKTFFLILILLFPLFIFLFLTIYRKVVLKKKANVIMIKKVKKKEIEDDEDEDELIDNNNEEEDNDYSYKKKVKIVPKWYKLMNEFFNFTENIKELFYFESFKTNVNDLRGLNYLNGLIGISMILTILGQLYLIFCNIPIKVFGI